MFFTNKDQIREMILIAEPGNEDTKRLQDALFLCSHCGLKVMEISGKDIPVLVSRKTRRFSAREETMSLPTLILRICETQSSAGKFVVLEGIDNITKSLGLEIRK